jgi:hypothetical protein
LITQGDHKTKNLHSTNTKTTITTRRMSGSSIYILNMKKVSGLRGGMLSAAPQVRVRIVCPTAAMCVDYETLTVTVRVIT